MSTDLSGVNLENFSLFHQLDEDVVRKFFSMGYRFRYETGSSIISHNDLGETFFLILNGMAKLVLVNNFQQEVNVTLFRTGDFFGELAILEPQSIRSGNIITITPMEVLVVQKKEFLKILHQHPEITLNLARILGHRLRDMNERMITERLPDDEHKVAHTLLMLAQKGKTFSEQGPLLLPPLSLKEWALFCYTSRDSLMAIMEKLKAMGILEWQNQRIAITDMDALQQCAQAHEQRLAVSLGGEQAKHKAK